MKLENFSALPNPILRTLGNKLIKGTTNSKAMQIPQNTQFMFLPKQLSILVFSFLIILTNQEESITSHRNKLIKSNTNSTYIYIYVCVCVCVCVCVTKLFIFYFYDELVNFIYKTKPYTKSFHRPTQQHEQLRLAQTK